jgi:hypothetical protein
MESETLTHAQSTATAATLLRRLQDWCARETGVSDDQNVDPDKPFHNHRIEWGKRFKLRNALLEWVMETTSLPTFYPDELDAHSTPRSVAEHLAWRLQCGHERRVRPPVLPRTTGKIQEPTVFLLGCPRSGTTILRCMLMGHSEIYAGPELHMMQFDSLLQRERELVDSGTYWMVMGFSQTIQHLTGWTERESFHFVSTLTKRDLSIPEVYRIIHGYCPKPIVVDKSPTLTRAVATMQKIEEVFEKPRYLYIVRHPYAVIESMTRIQICPPQPKHTLATAEEWWLQDNRNVQQFLSGVPPERWHRLSYESLMRDPASTLQGVSGFLGVAFEESMVNPYEGERLLTGIGCVTLPRRQQLEPDLADAWRTVRLERALGSSAVAMAKSLGYECS